MKKPLSETAKNSIRTIIQDQKPKIAKLKDPNRFILGGMATFTIQNSFTGNRYTYKCRIADGGEVYFVSMLDGPDNHNDYHYIGIISEDSRQFRTTAKTYNKNSVGVRGFDWVWRHRGNLPANVEVFHEGQCGRCGRKLTVPESIENGFGAVCYGKAEEEVGGDEDFDGDEDNETSYHNNHNKNRWVRVPGQANTNN